MLTGWITWTRDSFFHRRFRRRYWYDRITKCFRYWRRIMGKKSAMYSIENFSCRRLVLRYIFTRQFSSRAIAYKNYSACQGVDCIWRKLNSCAPVLDFFRETMPDPETYLPKFCLARRLWGDECIKTDVFQKINTFKSLLARLLSTAFS